MQALPNVSMTSAAKPKFGHRHSLPDLTAHRGEQIEEIPTSPGETRKFRVYVENTLDAFVSAAKRPGVKSVELDVSSARDEDGAPGELFVLHDDTLGRVFDETGRNHVKEGKPVIQCTNRDFKNAVFNFNTRRAPGLKSFRETIAAKLPVQAQIEFVTQDAKIPTYNDVLDAIWAENPDMHIYTEIKTPGDTRDVLLANPNGVLDKLAELFKRRKEMHERVTVIGFNPCSLDPHHGIKARDPKIKTGLDIVIDDYLKTGLIKLPQLVEWAKKQVQVDAFIPPSEEITDELGELAEQNGLKLGSWVWNEPRDQEGNEFERLVNAGVRDIITNNPDLLLAKKAAQNTVFVKKR